MQSNARLFALKEQKQRSRLSEVMKNIRMSSYWIRVALLLSEISFSMAWKTTQKLASQTFIDDRHLFKTQAIHSFHKDKNEDAGDIVFQMICKNCCFTIKCRFLNWINFARFCSSLIFIFSIIRIDPRLSGLFRVVPTSPDKLSRFYCIIIIIISSPT